MKPLDFAYRICFYAAALLSTNFHGIEFADLWSAYAFLEENEQRRKDERGAKDANEGERAIDGASKERQDLRDCDAKVESRRQKLRKSCSMPKDIGS